MAPLVMRLTIAIICIFASCGCALRPPSEQPNIVLFYSDDLGYGDLGFTGHPTTRTPNIDRLAAGGKVLTNSYTAAPVCSASRAAALTGRQPPRVGMPGVINSLSAAGLPLNETTVADEMRSLGYRTLAIGKWHQGQQPQYLPNNRGFDAFYGLPFSVDDGIGYASPCDADGGNDGSRDSRGAAAAVAAAAAAAVEGDGKDFGLGLQLPLPLIQQKGNESVILNQPTDLVPLTANFNTFITEFVSEETSSPSGRGLDTPMFLYIASDHVHTATPNVSPYEQYAGCPFHNITARGRFGDALAELDWLVGRVVALFDNLGLARNTLVIFTSDNGPWLLKRQGGGSMGLFTGVAAGYPNTGKGSTWEGGIRMPTVAYWPGTVAAGTRSIEIVSSMDFLPTFAELGAVALPGARAGAAELSPSGAKGRHLDGFSFRDILLFEMGRSKHVFLPFYNGRYYGNASSEIYAARMGKYKAHWITGPGLVPSGPMNATSHNPPLIFDVDADPSEAYPLEGLDIPPGLLDDLESAKAAYEAGLFPRAIDSRFGRQWALCCNWATNCTCSMPTPLPPPAAAVAAASAESQEIVAPGALRVTI